MDQNQTESKRPATEDNQLLALSSEDEKKPDRPQKDRWQTLLARTLFILPVVLAIIGFGWWQDQLAGMQHSSDRTLDMNITATRDANDQQLANDQQQEATLDSYLTVMSNYLIMPMHDLRDCSPLSRDKLCEVAIVQTLTTLRRLHAGRNRFVLQFLQDAQLIGGKNGGIISKANLNGVDLSDGNLSGADLTNDDLSDADLSGAILNKANLSGAILIDADLSGAHNLTQQQLEQVYTCKGATLPQGQGLECHRTQSPRTILS